MAAGYRLGVFVDGVGAGALVHFAGVRTTRCAAGSAADGLDDHCGGGVVIAHGHFDHVAHGQVRQAGVGGAVLALLGDGGAGQVYCGGLLPCGEGAAGSGALAVRGRGVLAVGAGRTGRAVISGALGVVVAFRFCRWSLGAAIAAAFPLRLLRRGLGLAAGAAVTIGIVAAGLRAVLARRVAGAGFPSVPPAGEWRWYRPGR